MFNENQEFLKRLIQFLENLIKYKYIKNEKRMQTFREWLREGQTIYIQD